MQKHRQNSPNESQSRDNCENYEPEPQKRVDLLIDDIEGHYAQRIVLLNRSRRTVLVKSALCHFGKNNVQSPHSFAPIGLDGSLPDAEECTAEEPISHVDLDQNVDEVQNFAKAEVVSPGTIRVKTIYERRTYLLNFIVPFGPRWYRFSAVQVDLLFAQRQRCHVQTGYKHLQSTTLKDWMRVEKRFFFITRKFSSVTLLETTKEVRAVVNHKFFP